MLVKYGWMDSISFSSELGHKPEVKVYAKEEWCEDDNLCIEKSRQHSEIEYPCIALEIVLISRDDWKRLLKIKDFAKRLNE